MTLMNADAFRISIDALTRTSLILLYAPVVLFCYWRLITRLAPSAKRLASFMLAAQIAIIVIAQFAQPASAFDRWLWDFHEEWNIPATFATLQLGTVGGVALLSAWLARGQPLGPRLYLVGLGVIFWFLAADEFLALHEDLPNWELRYIALGAGLVLATALAALRSGPRSRLWHGALLVGLALSVAGAIVVNALPIPCDSLLVLRFDGCIEFFVLEESLEFLGIWLTLVAVLGHFSEAAGSPKRGARLTLYALPLAWMLVLVLNALVPRLESRLLAQPAAVQFKSDVALRGRHIDRDADRVVLRLYVSAPQAATIGLGYSVHLVDQVTGASVASNDVWADRQHGIWLLGADYAPLYRQWIEVEIAPDTPVNRAYWIVLALWRPQEGGEFKRQKVFASDLPQLDDRQIILDEFALPADTTSASAVPLASFANGFLLEAPRLPEQATAGETLAIAFDWRSDQDSGDADYSQFLHFVHADSGLWWGYDQFPLGARLPTRLWYSGLADSETWQIPLPADLAPGSYALFTGLYRASDLQRVPATDADGTPWLDMRVALGNLVIQ